MNGTELLTQALILDIMVESDLIDADKMHDTLDELILKSRQEKQLELQALNAVEND